MTGTAFDFNMLMKLSCRIEKREWVSSQTGRVQCSGEVKAAGGKSVVNRKAPSVEKVSLVPGEIHFRKAGYRRREISFMAWKSTKYLCVSLAAGGRKQDLPLDITTAENICWKRKQ